MRPRRQRERLDVSELRDALASPEPVRGLAPSPLATYNPTSPTGRRRQVTPRGPAKPITDQQFAALMADVIRQSRSPESDRAKLLLSFKAGLRIGEIAELKLSACRDASGGVGSKLQVHGAYSKSLMSREIPLHSELRDALEAIQAKYPQATHVAFSIAASGRLRRQKASNLANWFKRMYVRAGLYGCSSHSGRRTFATKVARSLGPNHSLEDLKKLLGHRELSSTQCYIEPSPNLADLINAL